MAKLWKIAQHEFVTTVRRRSFILALVLIPLVPALLLGVVSLINQSGRGADLQSIMAGKSDSHLPMAVVNRSGLIKDYPEWLTNKSLVAIDNEAEARKGVETGQLQGYYLVSADYLQTGKVQLIKPNVSLFEGMDQGEELNSLIEYNLLGTDREAYQNYKKTVNYQFQPINPETADTRDSQNMAAFFVPYGVTMFFYFMTIAASSLMLQAVSKEKENRVIEVLLSSANPTEIFGGKVLGLGAASLLQMLVWSLAGAGLLRLGGTTLQIPSNMQIPWSAILLCVPFFLLGFAVYGSLMAGLGAMAPNLREASQSTFVITIPLIVSLLAVAQLIQTPHGPVSLGLSLFPLTAPVAMPARLSIGQVPLWQIALSLVLLAVTAVLLIKGVSRLFHAQTLLTGQKVNFRTLFKALFAA